MTGPHGGAPFYLSLRPRFTDQLHLAAARSAASLARRFTVLALDKWKAGALEDDAALVVCELVSNAVKATATSNQADTTGLITVRVLGLRDSIVIEVRDTSPETPVLTRPDHDSEGGRGLLLVQALSRRWGTHHETHHKTIWAQLPAHLPTDRP
ncbi:ATP-binding protein [Kitasatospora sp. NPDC052868]|uniref:ATP-binding protein n=1 Tax=Kitasatospora sp. NPDC052868 TaxID=3364060 RepID=UPI0037CB55FE